MAVLVFAAMADRRVGNTIMGSITAVVYTTVVDGWMERMITVFNAGIGSADEVEWLKVTDVNNLGGGEDEEHLLEWNVEVFRAESAKINFWTLS